MNRSPEDWATEHLEEVPLGEPKKPSKRELTTGVTLDDFRAYMPMHNYIFTTSGETWPAVSVNSVSRPSASAQTRMANPSSSRLQVARPKSTS